MFATRDDQIGLRKDCQGCAYCFILCVSAVCKASSMMHMCSEALG